MCFGCLLCWKLSLHSGSWRLWESSSQTVFWYIHRHRVKMPVCSHFTPLSHSYLWALNTMDPHLSQRNAPHVWSNVIKNCANNDHEPFVMFYAEEQQYFPAVHWGWHHILCVSDHRCIHGCWTEIQYNLSQDGICDDLWRCFFPLFYTHP